MIGEMLLEECQQQDTDHLESLGSPAGRALRVFGPSGLVLPVQHRVTLSSALSFYRSAFARKVWLP
jgi:hypothetical protein